MFALLRSLFTGSTRVIADPAPSVPEYIDPVLFKASVAAMPPYDSFCYFEKRASTRWLSGFSWPVLSPEVMEWLEFHAPGATVHNSAAANIMLEIWFRTEEERLLFKLIWGCYVHEPKG